MSSNSGYSAPRNKGQATAIWQVKKNGIVYAYGPEATFPCAAERKSLRSAGYRIYLNEKIFKEDTHA